MNSNSGPTPPTTPAPALAASLSDEDECHHVLSLALHHIETRNIAHQVHLLDLPGPTYRHKRSEAALVTQVRDFLKNPTLLGGTITEVNGLMARLQDVARVAECDLVLNQAVEYDFVSMQASKPAEEGKLRRADAKARLEKDRKARGLKHQKEWAEKGEANAAAEAQRLQNARITPAVMRLRLQELINHETINGYPIDEW